nr:50S ribosomal protein L17 [Bacteroidota bacterium]
MRHRRKFNHLSRTSAHRKAMLSNMATSLIMHKRITTTVAKAKALRKYVEPLLTRSKEDTTHSRRMVFSHLQSKDAVNELFREISTKIANRPGGYTRIIRMGNRLGDNAEMYFIELVDFNELMLAGGIAEQKAAGKRKRRRGSGKAKEQTAETKAIVEVAEKEQEIPVETPEVSEEVEVAPVVEEKVEEPVKPEAKEEAVEAEAKEEVVEEITTEVPEAKVEEEKKEPESADGEAEKKPE